jgi:putative flippase GtrA
MQRYDQRFSTIKRWLIFNSVGAIGFFVHMGVLTLLELWIGMNYYPASIAAVETAILHNFIWHERWTWADRRKISRNPLILRFLYFHLANGMVSLTGILLLVPFFVENLAFDARVANVFSIALCSIINFLAGDRIVFRSNEAQMNSGE